ncbi:hypothetical protein JHK86_000519 [Glycine max]|nr:hypothetical protein JHK86_000519 [Glycine max]
MENCWWEQELQLYNQYEEERIPNLENVLMQIMETSEATQHAIQNLEIQVGKLAKEVAKLPFLVTREENFVEVFLGYKSFMESIANRRKCKEEVFYVTFMPP